MNARAYTEANYIINKMPEEMKNKILPKVRKIIESRIDPDYEFSIEDDDFENAELLEDTEKILSVLYTDYLATDEEKAIIKNKENMMKNRRNND